METYLTRQQQREKERRESEASATYKQLCERVMNAFMESDPESQEMAEQFEKINAIWKTFCKRKGLKPEALPMVKQFWDQLQKEYQENKTDVV